MQVSQVTPFWFPQHAGTQNIKFSSEKQKFVWMHLKMNEVNSTSKLVITNCIAFNLQKMNPIFHNLFHHNTVKKNIRRIIGRVETFFTWLVTLNIWHLLKWSWSWMPYHSLQEYHFLRRNEQLRKQDFQPTFEMVDRQILCTCNTNQSPLNKVSFWATRRK